LDRGAKNFLHIESSTVKNREESRAAWLSDETKWGLGSGNHKKVGARSKAKRKGEATLKK